MSASPRTEAFTCPCCGGQIGEAAPIEAVIEAESSWVCQAILKALSEPVGQRRRRQELVEAIYRDRRQPQHANNGFKVALSHLRKRVEAFGWMIERKGSKGPEDHTGAVYRLIPIGEAR